MRVTVRFAAIAVLALGAAALFLGQTPVPAPLPASDEIYACPMDPDVRSHAPGICPALRHEAGRRVFPIPSNTPWT